MKVNLNPRLRFYRVNLTTATVPLFTLTYGKNSMYFVKARSAAEVGSGGEGVGYFLSLTLLPAPDVLALPDYRLIIVLAS